MAPVRPYEYARELIRQFRLEKAPVDVEALAKGLGLKITYFDNPDTTDPEYHKTLITACAWIDKSRKEVFVYKDMPVTRQRLSIAHEIMHFLNPYHACISPFRGDDGYPSSNLKPQERQAYEGALWLLFLGDGFVDNISSNPTGFKTINSLAAEHGVSQEATALWYAHVYPGKCIFLMAEPMEGLTLEQEDIMFSLADSGEIVPESVVLNSGRKLDLKPNALRIKYTVNSQSFQRRLYAVGRGVPFDSPLCYTYRSGDSYRGPVTAAELGISGRSVQYECECIRSGTPLDRRVMALAWQENAQQDLFGTC